MLPEPIILADLLEDATNLRIHFFIPLRAEGFLFWNRRNKIYRQAVAADKCWC
jgi:hypothetical protein